MNITTEQFNDVYNNFRKKLFGHAKNILKDNNKAEEIVQIVFTKFLKQDFDKISDHISQWLFTVCRNESFKFIAKNKRYVEAYEDDSLDESRNPHEELEFKEQVKVLKKCMRKLNPRQREVLKLRFFKDFNYDQSAKKMKTSTGNIGFMQSTTLKLLRGMMAKELNK